MYRLAGIPCKARVIYLFILKEKEWRGIENVWDSDGLLLQ
jgi:hypothetical protein